MQRYTCNNNRKELEKSGKDDREQKKNEIRHWGTKTRSGSGTIKVLTTPHPKVPIPNTRTFCALTISKSKPFATLHRIKLLFKSLASLILCFGSIDAERLCRRGRRRPEKSVSHWGRNFGGEAEARVRVRMWEGLGDWVWDVNRVGMAVKERIWRGGLGSRDLCKERKVRRFWRGCDSVVQEGLRYPYPQFHYHHHKHITLEKQTNHHNRKDN